MNSLTVQYALDYEKEGFTFIALCPGVYTLSPLSTLQNTEIGCLVDENRFGRW